LLPLSSPCTVAGVRESFAALLTGATLHLLDPQRAGLNGIRRAIRESAITICYAVPALLRSLLAPDEDPADLSSLRVVRLGGDRILLSDVQLLREALPRCLVQIAYSSTETTGTQWFVPPDFETDAPSMPVGYVLPGIAYAIIGDDGTPVPQGEIGELVVRSRYVALGLWEGGRCVPRVQRPASQHPGEWIFPTGDLVSLAPNGLLSMFGRKDRQVKIRGQRVEPAELEAALRRAPNVADATVIARRMEGDAVLVAFVTSRHADAKP
jgi:non-ribosomal peptide synthetase component F